MFNKTANSRGVSTNVLVFVLFMFVSIILSACGSSAPSSDAADELLAKIPDFGKPNGTVPAQLPNTFVGKVDGSDYFVAVVFDGDTAVGYLCDGKSDAWLKGSKSGDNLTLSSEDGASLAGSLSNNAITGTVTPSGGSALNFTASQAQNGDGLYRAVIPAANAEEQYVGGWIMIGEEEQGLIKRIRARLGGGNGGNGGGGNGSGGGNGGGAGGGDTFNCDDEKREIDALLTCANCTAEQKRNSRSQGLKMLEGSTCIISPFPSGEQP